MLELSAVDTMLHFIYTAEVKDGNAMENYAIAAKFEIGEMKSICGKKLSFELARC